MALRKTFNIENIVATEDAREEVFTRTVTVGGVQKTVVNRKLMKTYGFIGMDRRTAELCVKAKQAQYFRPRTYVNDKGVLVTEPAKVQAQVVPVYIEGDDWGVDVTLDQEDELFVEGMVAQHDMTVDDALRSLRGESCDQPVSPYSGTLSILSAQYGIDTSIQSDWKGFVVLKNSYQHSCFPAQYVNNYEAILEWRKEPFAENDWMATGVYDMSWQEEGIRFTNIPNFTTGDFVYMRLKLRSKVNDDIHWHSNVICQHWLPASAG